MILQALTDYYETLLELPPNKCAVRCFYQFRRDIKKHHPIRK